MTLSLASFIVACIESQRLLDDFEDIDWMEIHDDAVLAGYPEAEVEAELQGGRRPA